MDSWNVYPQNAPSTPNSTWLCPQNNTPGGSDWLHPQNSTTERERNENTALATPTRYIVEYNNVNQNSSSSSYCNPYNHEMEKLFDNNFLKLGNPEELLNNDLYNNNLSSWLNSNETIVPNNNTSTQKTTTNTNSPTPSLITDDGQDEHQNPVTTSASFIQYPITTTTSVNGNQQILTTMPPCSNLTLITINENQSEQHKSSISSSPISPRVSKSSSTTLCQTDLASLLRSTTTTTQNLDNRDKYLHTKRHDPKQLLLPLTTGMDSMDGTMAVSITSPTSSLATDDEDHYHQTKSKNRRQSHYQDFQSSISTNGPIQQPSPASSEFSNNLDSPPPYNEITPKQKKRRVSQRKPIYEQDLTTAISESDESPSDTNAGTSNSASSDPTVDSCKRGVSDDSHDETPEEKRARLLERNRIAAAKCRQKKKQAQECLQHQASELTQKNTTMHSLVNDLREEALKLKNQLLAHSTCNCNVIQEYVRTSGQFAFARASYSK